MCCKIEVPGEAPTGLESRKASDEPRLVQYWKKAEPPTRAAPPTIVVQPPILFAHSSGGPSRCTSHRFLRQIPDAHNLFKL
jgi:hypothetical protein